MNLTIGELLDGYRSGRLRPREVIDRTLAAARKDTSSNVWIHLCDASALDAQLARLESTAPDTLPLYGVPFAIKDNIDLAGVPTTAGCPDYAYVPERSATAVQRLVDAGAVPVGKTNLDQFATGLVGTRSPYGACRNPFDPAFVSGGSSSGSAVAVALGQVPFALGTDTAGSGRVPAAFCNLIGLKPTRGLVSTTGVVPACRSLDCVSVFAGTAADALAVLDVVAAPDAADPYSRTERPPAVGAACVPAEGFRIGVPPDSQLEFFGDRDARRLFDNAVRRLESLGGVRETVDLGPFLEAARLLYGGPWVAERYAAVGPFIDAHPTAVLDVIRDIIGAGARIGAADTFAALHRLQALKRASERAWSAVDVIVTPTTPGVARIEDVAADPVGQNSRLGYYTNFMNLLDLTAVAVPAGFRDDGLALGVTLFAPAFLDRDLLALADRLHRAAGPVLGASARALPAGGTAGGEGAHTIDVAVCGAHMQGLPLNHQLTSRNARLRRVTRSAPEYRFYALPGGPPHRPGMLRVSEGGGEVELEIWSVPADRFGGFVAGIPAPLGIGRVRLADGSEVAGFVCEAAAVQDATDITALGCWRRYLSRGEAAG